MAMQPARLYPVLLAAVGAGALATAYTAQYGFGLEPCVLCLYQRIPYALVAILGFAAMLRPYLAGRMLALAALVFLAGAGLAVYHFGVEQHWWASAAGCSGGSLKAGVNTADLLQSLEAAPPKPCDQVDWTVLGVSMAGWNALFSVLGAAACVYARKRLRED